MASRKDENKNSHYGNLLEYFAQLCIVCLTCLLVVRMDSYHRNIASELSDLFPETGFYISPQPGRIIEP